jgi:hypothetical protein
MARAAKGTLLQMGLTTSGSTFATIGEVRDIAGPGYSLETVDVTSHSSTGDYEEIVPTILRTGDVTFDINFDPKDNSHMSVAGGGSVNGLFHVFENKEKRYMRLDVPSSSERARITFQAYVTGFSLNHAVLSEQLASVVLKPTGAPVWTTATGA